LIVYSPLFFGIATYRALFISCVIGIIALFAVDALNARIVKAGRWRGWLLGYEI
jgi:hypothetical protein